MAADTSPKDLKDGGYGGTPGYIAYLPPAWLAVVMLLAVQGGISAVPVLSDYRLPPSAVLLVHAGLIAGAVTVLWGLYVLGLAFSRSRRFARHFVAWQAATILWIVAREIYVAVMPDFVFTPFSLAWSAAEIAVGLSCIFIVTRNKDAAAFYANLENAPQPFLVSTVFVLLGVILGGALGFGVGLVAGIAISDATGMSCFEGACGYFAVLIGLAGLLLGAIAGGVRAVRRARRRRRPLQGA